MRKWLGLFLIAALVAGVVLVVASLGVMAMTSAPARPRAEDLRVLEQDERDR